MESPLENELEPKIIDLSEDFLAMGGIHFLDKLRELKIEYRGKEKNELPKLTITLDCTSMDIHLLETSAKRLKAFLESSSIMQFQKSALMKITDEQYKKATGAHNAFGSRVQYEIVE